MSKAYKWIFRARFRARAFGWRSQPAVKRVREAVAEIGRAARRDPLLAAEGAVLFLERVSAAIEHVDSSSGSMGTAVNSAIEKLVPVIAEAPANEATRDAWLERLWAAFQEDEIPYIESLAESWGELCAGPERASRWADELLGPLLESWADRRTHGFFRGSSACLSSLLAAGRCEELLALLEKAPFAWWNDRQYGVRALAALGRVDEALEYADGSRGINDHDWSVASVCEQVLLDAGRRDEAYERYARGASVGTTRLATYRAIAKRYPEREPSSILADLVESSPGEEGKWFATARQLGLLDVAADLATRSPCDPKTLNRAARDHVEQDPAFALEVALSSLRWLSAGHGYEITGEDVHSAHQYATRAADALGKQEEARVRVLEIVTQQSADGFVQQVLGRTLG